MLRLLTPAEELRNRRKRFAQLAPKILFNLAQKRFFIAVRKVNDKTWEVVELSDGNNARILAGQPCEFSRLCFDEMDCLNINSA